MMPQQRDIDLPLLKALVQLGGQAPARDVYAEVERFFPQLTDADRSEPLPSGGEQMDKPNSMGSAGAGGSRRIDERGSRRLGHNR